MLKRIDEKNGFSLIELMVVVIILGIVVAIAIPKYDRTIERSIDKEAYSTLNLIVGAQKFYKQKYAEYWPGASSSSSDIDAINSNLDLDLVDCITGGRFCYTVLVNAGGDGFYTLATRDARGFDRTWRFCDGVGCSANEPWCWSGTCP